MSQEEEYEVETILARAPDTKNTGAFLYRVKWMGYGESEATWEPTENLSSVAWMVEKFNNQC